MPTSPLQTEKRRMESQPERGGGERALVIYKFHRLTPLVLWLGAVRKWKVKIMIART